MKTTETHKFKRGQKLHLDQIYDVQGLAGGRWWSAPDVADDLHANDEDVTIVEDITITIIVIRKD